MLSLQRGARLLLSRAVSPPASCRALTTLRHHQGEAQHPAATASDGGVDASCAWAQCSGFSNLYSLGAELQELAYLHSVVALERSAAEGWRAAEGEAAAAAADRLLHSSEVPVEPLAAGIATSAAAEAAQAPTGDEEELASACCDFYDSVDTERQLILRSSWLVAGAGSLADIRRRLEQRAQMIADLESDGWQLEAPVDDHEPTYACLTNPAPKPHAQRRVAEAWEIVESWERVD